ncbi:uncharacterized protein ACR2FA_006413 [Aphomia sociella]
MRIPGFSRLVERHLIQHELKNCTVVIDGQNFFYRKYSDSKLPYVYGCESDKYADYLRNYMDHFKKANVKCIIVFKGGHRNINSWRNKRKEQNEIVLPIFMKDVYKQVLDEIDIDYVISEFEAKDDVIAYAQKYKCPIISYDIEFCFSGESYIPYKNICFNSNSKSIKCGLFKLQNLLNTYNLDNQKISIFITLTDTNIFPYEQFVEFFKSMRMCNVNKNDLLLKWLGSYSVGDIYRIINRFLNADNTTKFLSECKRTESFICEQRIGGLPVNYLENKNSVAITENDLQWFEKGVALKHVAISYINLYRSNIIAGSWALEDADAEDSLLFSIEIIKYAYNLLTNYKRKEFQFIDKKFRQRTICTESALIRKPNYDAKCSPFENGWNNIKEHKFFEHFLQNSLPDFSLQSLEELSEDSRLLMIALNYFSYKTHIDATNIVSSVLLSYVMLGVIPKNNKNKLKNSVDENLVTKADSDTARNRLVQFFNVTESEAKYIDDKKLLHSLVEFQFCLYHLNFLNKLCGCPYRPTIYHHTYNGTFVYKILYAIEKENDGNAEKFVKEKLNPAPTVLSAYNAIYYVYEMIKKTLYHL